MKLYLILLMMLLAVNCKQAPPKVKAFEGEITYVIKRLQIRDTALYMQLRLFMPKDTVIAYVKNGSFITLMPHAQMSYTYFRLEDKRIYMKMVYNDTIMTMDASRVMPGQEVLDSYFQRNQYVILGHMCDHFSISMKDEKWDYYCSPDFPVDSALYKEIRTQALNLVYSRTQSLYLGLAYEGKVFSYTMEAIKIDPRPVPDSVVPKIRAELLRNLDPDIWPSH